MQKEFKRALSDIEAKLFGLVKAVQGGYLFSAQIDVSRRSLAEMAHRAAGRHWDEQGISGGLLLDPVSELRMFEDRRLAAVEMQLDSAEALDELISRVTATARRYPELQRQLGFLEDTIREVATYMPELIRAADHSQAPRSSYGDIRAIPDVVPRTRKLLRETDAVIKRWGEQVGGKAEQQSG